MDKADGVRRKRQEAIELTDELIRSSFLEMFGDPVTNPKGWPQKRFGDLVGDIVGGWSAKGENRCCGPEEFGVLKVSAVTSRRFVPKEHKAVNEHLIQPRLGTLISPKKGDLLFSRANTRGLVAATAIVHRDEARLFLPDKLWRLDLAPGRLTPEFVHMLFGDPRFRTTLTRTATGTSGSMLNISKAKLRDTPVPLPDYNTQRHFKRFYWATESAQGVLTSASERSEALFNALVQGAFRGKL